jgi:hypothetical protein
MDLELRLVRRGDADDVLACLVFADGEVELTCPRLHPRFFVRFDSRHEPWESAGGLDEAAEVVRAVVTGRVEARVTRRAGRETTVRFVDRGTAPPRRLGSHTDLAALASGVLSRPVRETRTASFL